MLYVEHTPCHDSVTFVDLQYLSAPFDNSDHDRFMIGWKPGNLFRNIVLSRKITFQVILLNSYSWKCVQPVSMSANMPWILAYVTVLAEMTSKVICGQITQNVRKMSSPIHVPFWVCSLEISLQGSHQLFDAFFNKQIRSETRLSITDLESKLPLNVKVTPQK